MGSIPILGTVHIMRRLREQFREPIPAAEVTVPNFFEDVTLFQKRIAEIIKQDNLLSDEDAQEILSDTQILARLNHVGRYAYQLLHDIGNQVARNVNTTHGTLYFRRWEQAVFTLYALTAPAFELYPAIIEAEKNSGLKSLNREENNSTGLDSTSVWTSQPPLYQFSRAELSASHLEYLRKQAKTDEDIEHIEKLERIKEDVNRWFGPAGLLTHTAVASWAMETSVRNLQKFISQEIAEDQQNTWHEHVQEMNPLLGRAWLNLHDIGRLITHDPHMHAVLTHVISRLADIPVSLFEDYDLPNILQFGNQDPLVPEFIEPPKNTWETSEEYANRVRELRVSYTNSILRMLMKNEETPDAHLQEKTQPTIETYDNPVAVLIFWLIDAYTKMYDIRQQRTLSSVTEPLDARKIKNDFAHYANLQPGDENSLFLGRFMYRLSQGDGSLENLSEKEQKMYRYYSRQYELARSIFQWLQTSLGIPDKLIWKLIFSFTHQTRKFLDSNGNFAYYYDSPPKDLWLSVSQLSTTKAFNNRTSTLKEVSQKNDELIKKILVLRKLRSNR